LPAAATPLRRCLYCGVDGSTTGGSDSAQAHVSTREPHGSHTGQLGRSSGSRVVDLGAPDATRDSTLGGDSCCRPPTYVHGRPPCKTRRVRRLCIVQGEVCRDTADGEQAPRSTQGEEEPARHQASPAGHWLGDSPGSTMTSHATSRRPPERTEAHLPPRYSGAHADIQHRRSRQHNRTVGGGGSRRKHNPTQHSAALRRSRCYMQESQHTQHSTALQCIGVVATCTHACRCHSDMLRFLTITVTAPTDLCPRSTWEACALPAVSVCRWV
jgi:hypothetical protein